MKGEQEAILRVGPASVSSTLNNKANNTAYGVASSALIPVPGAGSGCFITLKPVGAAGGDCCIALMGPGITAATALDMIFYAGQVEDLWLPDGCTGFFVIRATTVDGNLKWYRSSL